MRQRSRKSRIKMRKSNNKVSQQKIKRATKNKKRIQAKPYLSKFERQQLELRKKIVFGSLQMANDR